MTEPKRQWMVAVLEGKAKPRYIPCPYDAAHMARYPNHHGPFDDDAEALTLARQMETISEVMDR